MSLPRSVLGLSVVFLAACATTHVPAPAVGASSFAPSDDGSVSTTRDNPPAATGAHILTQMDSAPRRYTRRTIFGALLGTAGGGGAGYLLGSATTSGCRYDDCDVGGGLGYVVGSWIGGAVGAHIGARGAEAAPSFGRALAGSALGLGVGVLGAMVVGALNSDSRTPAAVTMTVTVLIHGGVTGLYASPARRRPPGQ